MRKIFFIICLIVIHVYLVNGQSELWGIHSSLGEYGTGAIYKTDSNGENFEIVYSFSQVVEGSPDESELCKANNGKLYGILPNGGVNNNGMIYEYDVLTNTLIKLHDFESKLTGGPPLGGLTLASNGKLYGMKRRLSPLNTGVCIYEFDPETNIYTKKASDENFRDPEGKLVMAPNGKLYGVTFMTLFEYNFQTNTLTKKVEFNNDAEGTWPKGITLANNGEIYGLTRDGGSNNDGVLFEYNPNTSIYTKLIDFDETNGDSPYNRLVLAANGNLYAMTSRGGIMNNGVIFEYDPTNKTFSVKYEFEESENGADPLRECNLTLASNGNLYGITESGGQDYNGVIFEFNPLTGIYNKVYDFGENGDNDYPDNIIFAEGDILYCIKNSGGSYNTGVLFEFNVINNNLIKKYDFTGAINGQIPTGKLIVGNDNKIYGTTSLGGVNNNGVIFRYDPVAKTYSKRYDFEGREFADGPEGVLTVLPSGVFYGLQDRYNGKLFEFDPIQNTFNEKYNFYPSTDGSYPAGGVTLTSNDKLYGVTYSGGTNLRGVIYEFDLNTNNYTKKYDFVDGGIGDYPKNKLTLANNEKLYGMTSYGGIYDDGVLYEYDPIAESYKKILDLEDAVTGSNPNNSLTLASNGKLYGLIQDGVLFEFDSETYDFTIKYDFPYGVNGYGPRGEVIEASNGKLYGVTIYGGEYKCGVLFEYDLQTGTYSKKYDFEMMSHDTQLTEVLVNNKPDTVIINKTTDINTSGFILNWELSSCANTYKLDVATDEDFTNILPSYNNYDVGYVNAYKISDLNDATRYYCRITAENSFGEVSNETSVYTSIFTIDDIDTLGGFVNSGAVWDDYDKDGDLDILTINTYMDMEEYDTLNSVYLYKYQNNKYNKELLFTVENNAGYFIEWEDFDSDGDLDILYHGERTGFEIVYKAFENNGGVFTEVSLNNLNVVLGKVDWGDYNNDGEKDVLVAGQYLYAPPFDFKGDGRIFSNAGLSFTEEFKDLLPDISSGQAVWGDINNDGYLDIIISGSDESSNAYSKIYKNTGTSFSEIYPGTLTDASYSSINCIDFNNDGRLDVLINGNTSENSTKLYKNNGDGFSEVLDANLDGNPFFSKAWGDYDNDGVLDVILSGNKIYKGDGTKFEQVYNGLLENLYGKTCWGDYDNDGDLDMLMRNVDFSTNKSYIKIITNNSEKKNTKAVAPINLKSEISNNSVSLIWDKTTDNETPQDGLTYNIEVYKKTTKTKALVLVTRVENVQYCETGYTLNNIEDGEYIWKVQAFDTGLEAGEYSQEQTFIIKANTGNTYYLDASICNGESYDFGSDQLISDGTFTETFTATDGSDSTVVLTLSLNETYNLTENVIVESGESFTFPDGTTENNITSQIVHISNLQTIAGCDSIIETTVSLVCNETYSFSESKTVCEGSNYYFPDGVLYTNISSDTSHTCNLKSQMGCDSIVEISLNIDLLPVPEFSYTTEDLRVIFKNESLYADFYIWTFGDGEISFVENPRYTYSEYGEFKVVLRSNNYCGSKVIESTVKVEEPTRIPGNGNNGIELYPNPANDNIYLRTDDVIIIEIYDLNGKKLIETEEKEIDISELSKGIYIVVLRDRNKLLIDRIKLIKE